MNAIRVGNLTGFLICLPLLIHLCGTLNFAEIGAHASLTILRTLKVLLPLQLAAIFLSTAWFAGEHSLKDSLLSNLILGIMPLPFYTLAWLSASISAFVVVKIIVFLTGVSFIAVALVWLSRCWQTAIRMDILFCILVIIGFLSASEQWLNWLL